ncbi:hypothetical protein LQW54_007205 [Pestalotiopsis sp. IQ-011]
MTEDVSDATIWQDDDVVLHVPKGKGKAIEAPSIVLYSEASSSKDSAIELEGDSEVHVEDDTEVDFAEYEPPAGLSQLEDTDSEIIVQLVQESFDKVRARIAEEKERRLEDAREAERLARQLEVEEAEAQEMKDKQIEEEPNNSHHDGKGKAPSIPKYHRVEPASFAGVKMVIDEHGLLRPAAASRTKSKQWGIRGLLKRLNNNNGNGESSTQGAARNVQPRTNTDTGRAFLEKRKPVGQGSFRTNTKVETPKIEETQETVECVSCLDDFSPNDMIKVTCHSYCTDCFYRLIRAACENEQQWPPKCCLNPIRESTILDAIQKDAELSGAYTGRSEEWSIPVADRIYCSEPDCGVLVKEVSIYKGSQTARCRSGHWTCTLCRGQGHGDRECPQDRELQRTEALAESEGWKRCFRCRAFVEHREACQHMTCRCGAQFCYVCGARWRTCGCTEGQLAQIKQDALDRRLARDAQTLREEADLAEALRQIEEYEREEALKEHLLMMEREFQEKQRREKEARERLRKETQRRKTVESKFQELRWELLEIHVRQRSEVVREHGKEENLIKYDIDSSTSKLWEAGIVQREAAATEAKRDFAEFKSTLRSQYAARLKYEQQVEESYQEQLKIYWSGQEGGDEQIEASLLEVKRRMDKGHRAYCRWMRERIDAKRLNIQNEQSAQQEHMQQEEKRLEEKNRNQQQTFDRKKTAELKWVDLVCQERHDMLDDMEETEMNDGDDINQLIAEFDLEDELDDELQEYFEASTTIEG